MVVHNASCISHPYLVSLLATCSYVAMNAAYALLAPIRVHISWRIVIARRRGDCAIGELKRCACRVGSGDSRMDYIYTDTAEDEVCRPHCRMDEKEVNI